MIKASAVIGEKLLLKEIALTGTLTESQVSRYVSLATKEGTGDKVMLGKFDGGVTSYINRAGTEYTYFDLGDIRWNQISNAVNGNADEMWKINKEFIDQEFNKGSEFFRSHNPVGADVFFGREIEYLTTSVTQGGHGGSLVQVNSDLWKLIK